MSPSTQPSAAEAKGPGPQHLGFHNCRCTGLRDDKATGRVLPMIQPSTEHYGPWAPGPVLVYFLMAQGPWPFPLVSGQRLHLIMTKQLSQTPPTLQRGTACCQKVRSTAGLTRVRLDRECTPVNQCVLFFLTICPGEPELALLQPGPAPCHARTNPALWH